MPMALLRKRMPKMRSDDDPPRGRIDLRAEPELVARITRQAKRLGLSVSGYIRMATTRRLEEDEADDPGLKRGKR